MTDSKTVVVLGAGASAATGAPLMHDFLDRAEDVGQSDRLTVDDVARFQAVFDGIHALQAAQSKAQIDINNVESVFAAFEMADLLELPLANASNEFTIVDAMRTVIVRTLEETISFPVQRTEGPPSIGSNPEYGGLAILLSRIREQEGSWPSILTFNYDCALDHALWVSAIDFSYGLGGPVPRDHVPLLKLHGSMNWFVGSEPGVVKLALMDTLMSAGATQLSRSWRPDTVRLPITRLGEKLHAADLDIEPMIVPPVWNKTQHYTHIRDVWTAAAQALQSARRILVFGYSLPRSDEFFRHLFALGSIGRTRIRSFEVFDPDASVVSRFKDLLGQAAADRFDHKPWPFGKAVGRIDV